MLLSIADIPILTVCVVAESERVEITPYLTRLCETLEASMIGGARAGILDADRRMRKAPLPVRQKVSV
jgi:hypothetical protein